MTLPREHERPNDQRLGDLLRPYCPAITCAMISQFSLYLELLLKWNDRTNLTSVRDPERIVTQHFGESLFLAGHLPAGISFLDLGSGGGFPGIPVQIVRPDLYVTLAESQNKKAAFLREVVRRLGFATRVWAGRVETMPQSERFTFVGWRAVDVAQRSATLACDRVADGGLLLHLRTGQGIGGSNYPVPGSVDRFLHVGGREVFHVEQCIRTPPQ